MLAQLQRGVKRKFTEGSVVGDKTKQRQSILDISMCKLQTSPIKRIEPSLRRSVLIFNTLKQIEYELRSEGVTVYPTSKSSLIPAIQSDDSPLEDVSIVSGNQNEHCISKIDYSSGVMSVPRTAAQSSDVITADGRCTLPMITQTGCLQSENIQVQNENKTPEFDNSMQNQDFLNANVPANLNGSRISPVVEDILSLTELDLNLYDMDLCALTSSPKLTSLSCEDLDIFAPMVTSISCKNEFLFEDVDSLMQVFVSSG